MLEDSHTSGVSRTKENDNEQLQEETVTGDRPNQLVIQNNHGNGPVSPQCVEGRSFNFVARSTATDAYQRLLNVNKNSIVNPEAAPEFHSAVNFVKGIKERFAGNPEIFRAFLDMLHPRDGKERPVDEILIQVSQYIYILFFVYVLANKLIMFRSCMMEDNLVRPVPFYC